MSIADPIVQRRSGYTGALCYELCVSKLPSEKVTIWNATASMQVPVLDALDMKTPFRNKAAALDRLQRSKAKAERVRRAFAANVPPVSIRKRVK